MFLVASRQAHMSSHLKVPCPLFDTSPASRSSFRSLWPFTTDDVGTNSTFDREKSKDTQRASILVRAIESQISMQRLRFNVYESKIAQSLYICGRISAL